MGEKRPIHSLFSEMHRLNIGSILTDITHFELHILLIIKKWENEENKKGIHTSVLAKEMEVAAPAISRALKSLSQKGYIERVVNDKDRRNVMVSITEEGRKVFQREKGVMEDFAQSVINRFGKEKAKQLELLLNEMLSHLKEELKIRQESNTERKEN